MTTASTLGRCLLRARDVITPAVTLSHAIHDRAQRMGFVQQRHERKGDSALRYELAQYQLARGHRRVLACGRKERLLRMESSLLSPALQWKIPSDPIFWTQ